MATPLRVATYNIHKGVRGVRPASNPGILTSAWASRRWTRPRGVPAGALFHHRARARHFERTWFGWPQPVKTRFSRPGLRAATTAPTVTRTASTATRCCRAGRSATSATDVSDHRFEQRGLLRDAGEAGTTSACMRSVAHLGLMHAQPRAPGRTLAAFIDREIKCRRCDAGGGRRLQRLGRLDATDARAAASARRAAGARPHHLPSRVPVFRSTGSARGLRCVARPACRVAWPGAHVRPPAAGGRDSWRHERRHGARPSTSSRCSRAAGAVPGDGLRPSSARSEVMLGPTSSTSRDSALSVPGARARRGAASRRAWWSTAGHQRDPRLARGWAAVGITGASPTSARLAAAGAPRLAAPPANYA